MNTKKKTILAAAFIVAILAFAGIGYAAAANTFTGKTTSASTNVYDVDYVVVSLDNASYAASTTPIRITYDEQTVWNSSASEAEKQFKWTGSDEISMTVTVDVPANATTTPASDPDTYVLTISPATTVASGYILKYKLAGGSDFIAFAGSELATGKTLSITPGTPLDLAITWTIVPDSDNGMPGATAFTTVDPANLLTQVAMPALEFTVTGTQHTNA